MRHIQASCKGMHIADKQVPDMGYEFKGQGYNLPTEPVHPHHAAVPQHRTILYIPPPLPPPTPIQMMNQHGVVKARKKKNKREWPGRDRGVLHKGRKGRTEEERSQKAEGRLHRQRDGDRRCGRRKRKSRSGTGFKFKNQNLRGERFKISDDPKTKRIPKHPNASQHIKLCLQTFALRRWRKIFENVLVVRVLHLFLFILYANWYEQALQENKELKEKLVNLERANERMQQDCDSPRLQQSKII